MIEFFKNATRLQRIFVVSSVLWVIVTVLVALDSRRHFLENMILAQIPLVLFWGIYWIKGAASKKSLTNAELQEWRKAKKKDDDKKVFSKTDL